MPTLVGQSNPNTNPGFSQPFFIVADQCQPCLFISNIGPTVCATWAVVGDPQELNAIDEVLCKGRPERQVLLIGSVKSNMGHSEAAAGVSSIAKIILAAQHGILPANLHYKDPNPNIPGLMEGRMAVVKENVPWRGGIVGINSFGFGGSNVHLILQLETGAVRVNEAPICNIPQLIVHSTRNKQGLEEFLKDPLLLRSPKIFDLLRCIHKSTIERNNFRGYSIPGTSVGQTREVQNLPPPLWLVFSGMGSQWEGMGKEFLCFETFRTCMENLARALKPFDVDLMSYINGERVEQPRKFFSAAISIAAIQIALVDLLKLLQIPNDGYIGHSLGEIICAYVDGCYSAEETILLTWVRSKGIVDSEVAPGAMASVGLTWDQALERCPKDVTPACHNAYDNVTVSGGPESIKKFMYDLQIQEIFAREVDSAGYAFHSDYMRPAEKLIREYFRKISDTKRTRSSKWISTSVITSHVITSGSPSHIFDYAGEDYFINNILSPVRFYDAMKEIPDNAVVIEISPHGILQSILKRSLPNSRAFLSLSSHRSPNNIHFFLDAVGQMFLNELQPRIDALYPKPKFPFQNDIPPLSPFVCWDHSKSWSLPSPSFGSSGSQIEINLKSPSSAFYAGCKINGEIVFSPSGYLILAWKALAMKKSSTMNEPIVFDDVEFVRTTILAPEASTKFSVNIQECGKFEILSDDTCVVRGSIELFRGIIENNWSENLDFKSSDNKANLLRSDFYEHLQLRGYDYERDFRGVYAIHGTGGWSQISWERNWVTFLDSMLQLEYYFGENYARGGTYLPKRIQRISIEPRKFLEFCSNNNPPNVFVMRDKDLRTISTMGVEIVGTTLIGVGNYKIGSTQDAPSKDLSHEDLSSFLLLEISSPIFHGNRFKVSVYNALNIRDMFLTEANFSTAAIQMENGLFGIEFCGRTGQNQRVMGILLPEAFILKTVPTFCEFVWEIPEKWSIADVANVPVAYATAYYALVIRGNVRTGERVFINAGAGGLAQAVIAVCLSKGCVVIVGVKSCDERDYLKRRFQNLTDLNFVLTQSVMNFENRIQELTKRKGVEVVVNCLTGKSLQANVRCLAEYGRFLELNKQNLLNNTIIGMSLFLKSIAFHGILMDSLLNCNTKWGKRVSKLLQEGIDSGIVQPLKL